MCVICIKLAGQKLPDSLMLEDMHYANPDLCGFSYVRGKQVVTHRGLDLYELLDSVKVIPVSSTAVFHFRIATSGTVNTINSHPFPLYGKKSKKIVSSKASLAHNGVFKYSKSIYSDTFEIVRMIESIGIKRALQWLEVICDVSTNKVALLTPEKLYTFGTFQNHLGYMVSNKSFTYQYQANKWNYTYTAKSAKVKSEKPSQWNRSCKACQTILIGDEINIGYCIDCQPYYLNVDSGYSLPTSTKKNETESED